MNSRYAIASIAFTCAASAHADVINSTLTGLGAGSNVRIHFQNYNLDVFAGQMRFNVSGGTGSVSTLVGTQNVFGADIQNFPTGATQYQITTLDQIPQSTGWAAMGPDKALALREIAAYVGNAPFAADAPASLTAAFQIAIWEVLADYSGHLGASSINAASGMLTVTSTNGAPLPSDITSYLHSMTSAIGSGVASTSLVGLANPGTHDVVMMVPASSSAMIAFAGVGVAFARPRRRIAS